MRFYLLLAAANDILHKFIFMSYLILASFTQTNVKNGRLCGEEYD